MMTMKITVVKTDKNDTDGLKIMMKAQMIFQCDMESGDWLIEINTSLRIGSDKDLTLNP